MFSSSSYIFVQLACKSENCQGFSENNLSRDCVVVSEFSFLKTFLSIGNILGG